MYRFDKVFRNAVGILLVYERTVKRISIVPERTVGKETVNAGTTQLQERMKCVRNKI